MKIKGLYQKRGWFYFQPPMKSGERVAAIALRTKDQAVAVDKAFELFQANALRAQSNGSFLSLLEEYLHDRALHRIHTAKTAHITRQTLTKLANDWGNPKVAAITRQKVDAWRAALQERKGLVGEKMSDASVGSYLRRLRGFLSWLVKNGHLRQHPMAGIRLGRVKKTRREQWCTVEQRELLLSDPPSVEIDLILHLGFFAGLRFGEMVAMEWSWLVEKSTGWVLSVTPGAVWQPKDKEIRAVEVHPRLLEALREAGWKTKGYVLAPKKRVWKALPAYRFNPKKGFASYVRKRGLPWVTYHTLRHSFATHLASSGAPMIEVAQALGDSLRVTEQNYIGVCPMVRSRILAL